jgi:hypothetical protein
MQTQIAWKVSMEILSGPNLTLASAVQVDAYDRIEVKVPDTTSSPSAATVDVQPDAAGKVKMLLIRSVKYGDNLKYKVHDTSTPERVLNDALFFGWGGQLGSAGKLYRSVRQTVGDNTMGQDVL